MPKSNQEIEIKLRVMDVLGLRRRLRQLRAQEIIPRTYESNTLYDTPSGDLARRGQLVRIRIEHPCANGDKKRPDGTSHSILTYKGPPRSAQDSKTDPGKPHRQPRFKIREEVELSIGSGEQMDAVLAALDFRPTFHYEKFRTTYALPGIRGLKVEFDETPVGLFLELEGSAGAIDRAAKLLGYAQSDYLTTTYGDLYLADCRRRGRKPSHMLFPAIRKLC